MWHCEQRDDAADHLNTSSDMPAQRDAHSFNAPHRPWTLVLNAVAPLRRRLIDDQHSRGLHNKHNSRTRQQRIVRRQPLSVVAHDRYTLQQYATWTRAPATDVASLFRPHLFTPRSARPIEYDRASGTYLQIRHSLYTVLVGLRTSSLFICLLHNCVKRTLLYNRIMFITIYEKFVHIQPCGHLTQKATWRPTWGETFYGH